MAAAAVAAPVEAPTGGAQEVKLFGKWSFSADEVRVSREPQRLLPAPSTQIPSPAAFRVSSRAQSFREHDPRVSHRVPGLVPGGSGICDERVPSKR